MIKSNKGVINVHGEAVMVLAELSNLVLRIKELIKGDKTLTIALDSELLAMFLAKNEKEFLDETEEIDKEKLFNKIEKVLKYGKK